MVLNIGAKKMADTKEFINCPACGKQMKKIYLPKEKVNIDICLDGCGGIFFDNREFDKFNESHEDISAIIETYEGKTYTPVDGSGQRTCPACGMKMVQNTTKAGGDVVIDECYGCGGKFLDHNELEKIRAEFPTDKERSEAAMKVMYSRVGAELSATEAKQIAAINNRSFAQNAVFKLFGVK